MRNRKLRTAVRAALTHVPNSEKVDIVKPEVGVKNNLTPKQLQVSDADGFVNTHFSNLVTATAKKLIAGTDGIFVHKSIGSDEGDVVVDEALVDGLDAVEAASDDVEEAEEVEAPVEESDTTDDIPADIDSEIDETISEGDVDVDIDDTLEDLDDEGTGENSAEEQDEKIESGFEDGDLEEEPAVEEPLSDEVLGEVSEAPLPEESETELEDAQVPQQELEMDLVDVDEMADNDVDDLEFVASGNKVHAIKANRIIATLTKRGAIVAGVGSTYQSDKFADAVAFECTKQGLRAGLKSCGFVMAKVAIKADKVLKAKLEAKTKEINASVETQRANDAKSWQQCLALACEGINRKMFRDFKNPLRANLVATLQSLGVTNAEKMVQASFRDSGTETMKQIVALATRIQAMPEDVRDNIAEQLDMTVEPEGFGAEDGMYEGEGMEDDYIGDSVLDSIADEDEYIDEDVYEDAPLTAALSNPLRHSSKKKVTASTNKDSLTRLKGLSFSLY